MGLAIDKLPSKGVGAYAANPDGSLSLLAFDAGGNLKIAGSITASLGGFNSTFDTTLPCSNVTARKQLTGTGNSVVIDNSAGAANAHVKFGNVTVNAVVTDQVVPAGRTIGLDSGGAGYVAIILDSGSATINISQGTGLFAGMGGGGSGGGGGNVNLNQVGGAAYALGAAAMAASMPVTISSDQSNLPLNLKAVNGAAFALGQTTKSASLPVTLASDQGNLPVAVQDRTEITGTISSAAVFSNFPVTDTIGSRCLALQVTAIAAASTLVVEESNDGTTWTNLTSIGGAASITATGLYGYNFSAKQIRVRQSVYGGAGSSTVTAELRLEAVPHDYAIGAPADSQATDATSSWSVIAMLKGIYTKLGSVVLAAGSNLIGNVGHGKTIKTAPISAITADTDVVAAVASKRIKVIAYALFTTGTNASTLNFKSNGAGGTLLAPVMLQSQASAVFGANLAVAAPSFLFATVAGEKLTLDVGNTDPITGFITYFDDDAT